MAGLVDNYFRRWLASQPENVREIGLLEQIDLYSKETSAWRVTQLEVAVRNLIRLYGRRGGDADNLLPSEEQEPEVAAAMMLLPEH